MDILIGILTVVEVLVCLLLILIVLMQRPRQEGLGASFGDGAMTQLVGAQTTNVLQKGTVYLAVMLFVLTLSLAVLTTKRQTAKVGVKVFDEPPPAAPAVTPATAAPTTPAPAPAPAPQVKVEDKSDKPADSTKAPEASKPAEAPKPAPAATKEAAPSPKPTAMTQAPANVTVPAASAKSNP
jgi:preprotein translocase subunit SecG